MFKQCCPSSSVLHACCCCCCCNDDDDDESAVVVVKVTLGDKSSCPTEAQCASQIVTIGRRSVVENAPMGPPNSYSKCGDDVLLLLVIFVACCVSACI